MYFIFSEEPDSERRYRPEAHGSAQKVFEKYRNGGRNPSYLTFFRKIFVGLRFANPTYELLTIQICHSERSEESDL